MGLESKGDRLAIAAAISELRMTCEESLFTDIHGDAGADLILVEMRNQLRVNLELIEAMSTLLSNDFGSSYAALALARSSFEYSITAAWVLSSLDVPTWRSRFASVLHDDAKQGERSGYVYLDENSGPAREFLQVMRDMYGSDIEPIKPLPNVRDRLRALGLEEMYLLYGLTSQVSHGSRAAYQARYGWGRQPLNIDTPGEWGGALSITLHSFYRAVSDFAEAVTIYNLAIALQDNLDDDHTAEVIAMKRHQELASRLDPVLLLLDEAIECL